MKSKRKGESMSEAYFQAHQSESHRIRQELFALEKKAGIRDEHERFNEANSDNDLRRLYFSVRDKEIRKELIAKYRGFLRYSDGYTPARIRDAQAVLRALEDKGSSPPWAWPSAIVSGAVWIGWSFAALPGALAGAVAGFFAGNAYVSDRRNAHSREVSAAKSELAELEAERKREERPFGNLLLFSEQEEQSGFADEGPQPEPDLHWFARTGWEALVAKEIAKGADVEAVNNEAWGSRPLHRAAAAGNASIVKMLLAAGANPNAGNTLHSFTPLHSAAASGSADCVEALLAAGASIHVKDRYGFLPLHRGVESSDAATVLALARAGSQIEQPSDAHRGNRPLHIAAQLDNAEVVEALLSLGADPSTHNAHGETPLDMASYEKRPKFDKTRDPLIQAGARRGKTQEVG